MTTSLSGLGTALITPFSDNGDIDYSALDRLLDLQLKSNVNYLVILGTTAEAATLTTDEQLTLIQHIINYVHGQKPLVLGVGGNNTANVIQRIQQLTDTLQAHFAAILSVCPYYNKPTQEGLFQHFSAIAEACPIPVILYNVPGRTAVNMLPETVMRLYNAHPDKIIGIKEASGDIEQITQLIDLAHNRLLVISGDDGIACELMNAGADGLISVASNAFPNDFARIVQEHSMTIQQHYAHLIHLLFVEGNPAGIKTVLSIQGIIHNNLRLPLVPNSPNVQMIIQRALRNI